MPVFISIQLGKKVLSRPMALPACTYSVLFTVNCMNGNVISRLIASLILYETPTRTTPETTICIRPFEHARIDDHCAGSVEKEKTVTCLSIQKTDKQTNKQRQFTK